MIAAGDAMETDCAATAGAPLFDLALHSDVGTGRAGNEDSCGQLVENERTALFVVADGVGGYEGGEIASAIAVEATLNAFRDSPAAWGPAKRLYRAVQNANIAIHNKALVVPELRRMATTCTAVAIAADDGMLHAAHVGDCRLYLIRERQVEQLSRDHTVIGERVRMGLLSAERARNHPDRSALSRCLGQDLIASIDQITIPLRRDDRIVICSDGLWSVVEEHEVERITRAGAAAELCRRLVEEANRRGTPDNLTVGIFRMHAEGATAARRRGWRERLAAILGLGR